MSRAIGTPVVSGAEIIEQLTLQLPNVEIAEGRRAWHEAQAAWPGDDDSLWWKWLTEASRNIGLNTKTIDCTFANTLDLLKNGVTLVVRSSEDGAWLLARPSGRHRFELFTGGHVREAGLRELKHLLKQFANDVGMRCVVIRSDISPGGSEQHGLPPLARLQAILKPEWSDIWIVIVFAFVVGLLMLATPIAVEALVNTVAFGRFLQPVIILAIILLTFLSFSAAVRALQTYVVELIQRRLFARIAGDLAFRLPRTKLDEIEGKYVPELVNRFFDIVTVQKVAAQLLLDGVGLILSAIIGMAVLAFYHPWLLGFDIVMMTLIAFIILVLGHGAIGSAVKESKHKYYMASWLQDIARCHTAFRMDGGSDLALERADRLVHEYLDARQNHFRILMRQIVFALGLQAVASTALLGIGGWLVIDGQLTLGQLVAAELIVTVIVRAFAKLGKHMESFYDLAAAADKLGNLIDLPTEHSDGIMEMHSEGQSTLVVDRVEYKSGPSYRQLKKSVSFRVDSGGSIALLGGSGSGKSTLLEMMFGSRSPTAGHVTIDGFDPQDVRPDILRRNVAIVRRPEIFHGSLTENIHLQRPAVTSSDVRWALEIVGLYDAILRLPRGFDTQLSATGSPLSETQQNLLCIARAIAGKPRLLLVDGTLDRLPDMELDYVISRLLQEDNPWSLVVATGRESIASQCNSVFQLPSAGQSQE